MVGYEMLGEASNRKEFMKILVTGGAGYIGSVVVEQLIAAGVGEAVLYLGDNVRTGLNLLESMVEHGVTRVILSSTANLFDQPERMPIDESERIIPGSPYGESNSFLSACCIGSTGFMASATRPCATSMPPAPRRTVAKTTTRNCT